MTKQSALSLGTIALVLAFGVTYLVFGVLQVNPFKEHLSATVLLNDSGGLRVNSPVLLVGYEIGRVTEVRVDSLGAEIDIRYDESHPIPQHSTLAVETLSALGEPYLQFAPNSSGGPFLADHERIDARTEDGPVTVSAAVSRAVALIDQFDPDVIGRLVGTLDTALDGTEDVMPTLRRSMRLLAETLLLHNPQFESLLADIQALGDDLGWLGPTLEAGGPAWASVGDEVIAPLAREMSLLAEQRDPDSYVTGDGLLPTLRTLNDLLVEIGPEVAALVPVLQPAVTEATNGLTALDIGTLLDQALSVVDDDGTVNLRINVRTSEN
ncbi:MlaD family protein [Rhodococcus artemisiae]|uniref:MlaD family protein n=1 Tax=Rhodococcus artemisiae TaxID=714159 RepID=A0ABU7LAI0_9NOCA|nr:MlaD family protein [Rhodococcus artemisiae]MEE2058560.1 MlaD family protein [Rhodococcus artemisiae]